MTPIEFTVLTDRIKNIEERNDRRTALICTVLCNINRPSKDSKVFSVGDFMPGGKPAVEKLPESPEQRLARQLEMIRIANAGLGGKETINVQ